MSRQLPTQLVYLAICYLCFGSLQTVSLKFTEGVSAPDWFTAADAKPPVVFDGASDLTSLKYRESNFFFLYNFIHPFAQALFMFTAESLCLVVFFVQSRYQGEYPKAAPHHPLVYLIPAASDFFASVIQNIGLFLTFASVYQMLRGATVVWIAVFSAIIFRRHYRKIEKWGVAIVVLGLTCVGMSAVYGSGSGSGGTSHHYPNQILGNLLIVGAQLLHAIQGVAEERLMILYDLPPLQVVGMEGVFGLSLSIMLLALLQVFPVSRWGGNVSGLQVEEYFPNSRPGASSTTRVWGANETSTLLSLLQPLDAAPAGVNSTYFPLVPYDDIHLVFNQMRSNAVCLLCVLAYISSGLLYNVAQISIIKLSSAAATVMLGSLRNITVWMICLIIPSFHETLNFLQLFGFFLLIIGNILFQKVVYHSFEEFLPSFVLQACPVLFAERTHRNTPENSAVRHDASQETEEAT